MWPSIKYIFDAPAFFSEFPKFSPKKHFLPNLTYRKIFKNFAVNEELLKLTDAALVHYFIVADIEFDDLNRQIGKVVTWHNFFSNANYAWNPKLTKTIMQYLAQNKPKLKSIQDKL